MRNNRLALATLTSSSIHSSNAPPQRHKVVFITSIAMARTTRSMAAAADTTNPQQPSIPPATPADKIKKGPTQRKSAIKSKKTHINDQATTPVSSRKRPRKSIKQEETDANELPHNLGTVFPTPTKESRDKGEPPAPKRVKLSKQEFPDAEVSIKAEDGEETTISKPTPKNGKKANNYGLTPGLTPYPDYKRPTPEECQEVKRLLEKAHGKKSAPKVVPQGSMDYAGCGEVPSVVEALVRTRLSAATTGSNSTSAMKGLFKVWGYTENGADGKPRQKFYWNQIRLAPQKEVFEAIKCGGLAQVKSKDIQTMLQMIWEENQERKAAHLDPSTAPAGAENEGENEKQDEISRADENIISLDHIHLLSTQEAIDKMITYPGIGPKTASCVALFCLQRPSFAVDTHVFRLCQYLGWVPKTAKKGQPKVDRNTTYSHCDVRVPDDMKYELHQLFLDHGKHCPRCRAATGQNSANWAEGCVIEHLVKRHGAKKGGISTTDRKKAQNAAGLPDDEEDEEKVDGGSDFEEDEE